MEGRVLRSFYGRNDIGLVLNEWEFCKGRCFLSEGNEWWNRGISMKGGEKKGVSLSNID